MFLFYCIPTAVEFGYPNQPKLFNNLDFGIDMKSRSKKSLSFMTSCEEDAGINSSLIDRN